MNIKKLFIAAIVALVTTMAGTCLAQITKEEMSAGGVFIGQKYADVIAVHGQPARKENYSHMVLKNCTRYSYGKDGAVFDIIVSNTNNEVGAIYIKGDSGISTKAGIKINSTRDEVKAAYGKPDSEDKDLVSYVNAMDRNWGIQLRLYMEGDRVTEIRMDPWLSFSY